MDRSAVMAVVIKHLKQNVDGLVDSTIDSSRAMLELGASSLDVVEIVSAAMRELKIRVPRTELAKLKNIDGLVDLLTERMRTSAAS